MTNKKEIIFVACFCYVIAIISLIKGKDYKDALQTAFQFACQYS